MNGLSEACLQFGITMSEEKNSELRVMLREIAGSTATTLAEIVVASKDAQEKIEEFEILVAHAELDARIKYS